MGIDTGGDLVRTDQRRIAILNAATEVILARGADGARLREVSQSAGVSIGLIQHYFGSRAELIREAISYASERLLNKFDIDESEIVDPWKRIDSLIYRWSSVDDLVGHSSLWLHFADSARHSEQMRSVFEPVYRRWFDYVHRSVTAGVAEGSMQPTLDVDDAVSIFMAFFDGFEVEMATRIVEPSRSRIRSRAKGLAVALFRPTNTCTS